MYDITEILNMEFMKKVILKDGYIMIYDERKDAWWYDIEASRIKTVDDVTHWIYHLSEKAWISTWQIHEFMDVCKKLVPELRKY